MKKRIIAIAAVLMMLSIPAKSQVFMLENGDNPRAEVDGSDFPYIPIHGEEYDQGYAPVGGGAALLIGFGAAYLLSKRKK